MPYRIPMFTILSRFGWTSKTSGPASSQSTALPTSSKKCSYEPPGVWFTSYPAHPLTDVLAGVQVAPGDVDERARARPYGAAF
jgi:hypothetical protein